MKKIEMHEYESSGKPDRACSVCGQLFDTEIHHVIPDGWCDWITEDHNYDNGECRSCGAEEPWGDEDDDDD